MYGKGKVIWLMPVFSESKNIYLSLKIISHEDTVISFSPFGKKFLKVLIQNSTTMQSDLQKTTVQSPRELKAALVSKGNECFQGSDRKLRPQADVRLTGSCGNHSEAKSSRPV